MSRNVVLCGIVSKKYLGLDANFNTINNCHILLPNGKKLVGTCSRDFDKIIVGQSIKFQCYATPSNKYDNIDFFRRFKLM